MNHDLGLATCSYTAFTEDMGTPVRTSVDAPWWPLKYDLEHKCPLVYPGELRRIGDPDEFTPLYRAVLDEHAGEIAEELAAIAGTTGKRPVLLCFENLWKGDGTWCHRRTLAEWLEERTGLVVPELSVPKPPRVAKAIPEMSLFGEIDVPRRTR